MPSEYGYDMKKSRRFWMGWRQSWLVLGKCL